MLTWEVCPDGGSASRLSPGDAGRLAAQFVDMIGNPAFGEEVVSCLNEWAGVDFWSVYRLSPAMAPKMFISASHRGRDVSGDCFSRYTRGLYRDDRTFHVAQSISTAGRAAMTLWNEAEIPSPHRDEIYRRHGIGERLSVVCADADDGLMAVNLYRYSASGSFRSADVDTVQCLGYSLMSCVRKHIQFAVPGGGQRVPDCPAEQLLRHCPTLTRRELEVCERLLRGWTYEGIAVDLGLSPASVKTYRNRAFDRLGIHFRNELFALVAHDSARRLVSPRSGEAFTPVPGA